MRGGALLNYQNSNLPGLATLRTKISEATEIIRLKLRIIGFSNKRSGLFTRLGETCSALMKTGADIASDEDVKSIQADILISENEISAAEKDIIAVRTGNQPESKNKNHDRDEEKESA